MQAKLDAAKEGLVQMMMNQSWRKEWQAAVIKWASQVVIKPTAYAAESIVFPTDAHLKDKHGLFLTYDPATLLPLSSNKSDYSITSASNYRNASSDEYGLLAVPINLVVDIYRHFVLAFGLTFSTIDDQKSHCYQYLRIDEKDEFRRQRIHCILNKFTDLNNHSTTTTTTSTDDHWARLWMDRIPLGGKLLPTHYIEFILRQMLNHQIDKMIEHYFHHSQSEVVQCELLIIAAKRFVKILTYNETGEVKFIPLWHPLILVAAKSTSSKLGFSDRKLSKNFNLDLSSAIKDNDFVRYLGDLTVVDVEFLIRLLIDARHDHLDTVDQVIQLGAQGSPFPAATDAFENFDPPHLRGLLATTVLSKKLATYALGTNEINDGQFAHIAPTALVKIVGSYYSIDID